MTYPDQVKSNLQAFKFLRFIYAFCRALVKEEIIWVKDGGSFRRFLGTRSVLVLSVADMQRPNDIAAIGDEPPPEPPSSEPSSPTPPTAPGLGRFEVFKVDDTHFGVTAGTVNYVNTLAYIGTGSESVSASQDVYLQVTYTNDSDGNANGLDALTLTVVNAGDSPGDNDATQYFVFLGSVTFASGAITAISPYTTNNISLIVCGDFTSQFAAP